MSTPNALLALADVASVYEGCASYAASLASRPAFLLPPTSTTASQSSMSDTARSSPPISSRPAKKRPVPLELTQAAALEVKAEPSKKTKIAPKTDVSTVVPRLPPSQPNKSIKDKSDKKKPKTKRSRRNTATTLHPSFPAILMGIISTPQNASCITFLSDDRRFVITDAAKFQSEVLPMHFEATPESPLYASFVRMLEEWGFKSEPSDELPGIVVYGHPTFRKGDWEGCLNICKPGSVDTTVIKQIPLAKPRGVVDGPTKRPKAKPPQPVIPVPKVTSSQMEPPSTQNLALLNASLSKHMAATESSRILCNRFGLLQDPSALQAMMQAQQARSLMITAAVEGLNERASPRTISPEFNQTVGVVAGAQPNPNLPLDMMTARFIKSSMERMQSRQVMRSHFNNGFGVSNNI